MGLASVSCRPKGALQAKGLIDLFLIRQLLLHFAEVGCSKKEPLDFGDVLSVGIPI